MKVIFPVNETVANKQVALSRVFGNAKSYLLIDTNTDEEESIENTFYGAKDIHIATDLSELGIDVVVTEKLCKTCHKNITRAGIDVWMDDGSINAREALNKMSLGGLFPMKKTNLTMHKMDKVIQEKEVEEEIEHESINTHN